MPSFGLSRFIHCLHLHLRETKISQLSELCLEFSQHVHGIVVMKFSMSQSDKFWTKSALAEQLQKSY